MEMNFTKMEIETNSTKIIKLMGKDNQSFTNTLLDCRLLMHQLKVSILRHNFREGNGVAHQLAKEAITTLSQLNVFTLHVPFFLLNQNYIETSKKNVVVLSIVPLF